MFPLCFFDSFAVIIALQSGRLFYICYSDIASSNNSRRDNSSSSSKQKSTSNIATAKIGIVTLSENTRKMAVFERKRKPMELTVSIEISFIFCCAITCLLTPSLAHSFLAWRLCACVSLMPFTLFSYLFFSFILSNNHCAPNHSITPNNAKNFSTAHSFNQQALFVSFSLFFFFAFFPIFVWWVAKIKCCGISLKISGLS